MLLKLLLLRVALAASAPPAPPAPPARAPSEAPSATARGVLSVSPISLPSFLSKPSASSSIRIPLPPVMQPLPTVLKSSVTERTLMSSRASSTVSVPKLHAAPAPLPSIPTVRPVRPEGRVSSPHVAFPTKPLKSANRKPPPVAKLSQYLKEPSVFGPDSSDLDSQPRGAGAGVPERAYRRLAASTHQDQLLLEELKRVLQENNEDYMERTPPDIVDGGRRMWHGRDRKRRRHHKQTTNNEMEAWGDAVGAGWGPHAARRGGSWEREPGASGPGPGPGLLTVSLPDGDPAASTSPATPAAPATPASVSDKHRKHSKAKTNLKRFMAFVKKNRAMLKAFIQEKKRRRKQEAGAGADAEAEAAQRTRSGAYMRGLMGGALRATHGLSAMQLDLSPARGERIDKMRVKGRICQRNVMNPEGPKYDSRGKTYLPAFSDSPRKRYGFTKQKNFLLPICCNCCKKSVLGCE